MQKIAVLKKHLPFCIFFMFISFMGIVGLRSTVFKNIVSMNPIYSQGDPLPSVAYVVPLNIEKLNKNNSFQAKIPLGSKIPLTVDKLTVDKQISQEENGIKKIATALPTSIIPHYVPQKKLFYKRYVVTVNSYLKNKNNFNKPNLVFQGKIPQKIDTIKHLKPVYGVAEQQQPILKQTKYAQNKQSYTLPIYKQYVSIQR